MTLAEYMAQKKAAAKDEDKEDREVDNAFVGKAAVKFEETNYFGSGSGKSKKSKKKNAEKQNTGLASTSEFREETATTVMTEEVVAVAEEAAAVVDVEAEEVVGVETAAEVVGVETAVKVAVVDVGADVVEVAGAKAQRAGHQRLPISVMPEDAQSAPLQEQCNSNVAAPRANPCLPMCGTIQ
eukprot:CAMPEP_0198115626 /NCGR_PEP_ID=MMETSP1442-20131203/6668_1 /TAXON_ID= /ORGANISM="Craspedostauros australis, Strain CCMP3328" /LENGTH=182 /DNA_ID=CAMNT_0043773167 /DNA_START=5 /DNA_END=555 /DNA_ORIENTATION=+